jgi:hypothetical protein
MVNQDGCGVHQLRHFCVIVKVRTRYNIFSYQLEVLTIGISTAQSSPPILQLI